MSHVATIDLHVKDLEALVEAAKLLGMELKTGQTTYRWWGRSVGDYPLPEGFKASDLGKCEHALTIPGNPRAYEVGVVKRRDGKPGYTLLWDFYGGGYGLRNAIGEDGVKLKGEYSLAVAAKIQRARGYRVERKITAGKIQLVCTK